MVQDPKKVLKMVLKTHLEPFREPLKVPPVDSKRTLSSKSAPSRIYKSHERQFSRNWVGRGYLVAVTGSTWLLRGLRPATFRENRLACLLRDRFTWTWWMKVRLCMPNNAQQVYAGVSFGVGLFICLFPLWVNIHNWECVCTCEGAIELMRYAERCFNLRCIREEMKNALFLRVYALFCKYSI